MGDFLTYARYHSLEDADFMIALLKEASIPYELEQELNQLDPVYIGHSLDPMISLRIPQDRFDKVNQLVAMHTVLADDTGNDGYYLDSYDDHELLTVLGEPNKHTARELIYAKKLLVERGIVDDGYNVKFGSADTYTGERLSTSWIIIGYIMGLLSVIGLFNGLVIVNSKKTLPNGHVVKIYDEQTRAHGKIFVALGVLSTIIIAARIFAGSLESVFLIGNP